MSSAGFLEIADDLACHRSGESKQLAILVSDTSRALRSQGQRLRLIAERTMKECGHLTSRHEIVRTELIVGRRIAALGRTSGRQLVDVILDRAAVIIHEQIA